jgi:hypothetical protein
MNKKSILFIVGDYMDFDEKELKFILVQAKGERDRLLDLEQVGFYGYPYQKTKYEMINGLISKIESHIK